MLGGAFFVDTVYKLFSCCR